MRALKRSKFIGLFVATVAAAGLVPLAAGTADAAPVAAAAATGSCPAAGTVTQWWHSGHDGVDIANSRGTAIYATGAGTVIASGPASGYGQWIRIRHDDGTITEYGHMYERLVSVNQRVTAGQHIARMGSEGDSSGNHLHLRTYASASASRGMNPVDYLSARGVGLPCTPGGGGETPGTNFSTWGTSVRVRQDARLNAAVVRTLTGPTPVYVECQKRGDSVTAEGYTNDAWSYIPALGGYITNIYIDHPAAWLPGVREC
ncbi:M23 family metallopeptidase [Streptomyces geranii]|uniref:M23 family metallopeptidase n=1 Tax=Streptomyces geranii TaxID=2058923 RepID=UPI000D03EC6F|nr:M23 family metallopeptidase [Streptomyces geranii]